MRFLPIEERKNKRCHYCGSSLSVKYAQKIIDPVVSNDPVEVCMCNRCALIYSREEINE